MRIHMIYFDGRLWERILGRADKIELIGKVWQLDVVIYKHGKMKPKRVIDKLLQSTDTRNLLKLLSDGRVRTRDVKYAFTEAVSQNNHVLAERIWRFRDFTLDATHVQHLVTYALRTYRLEQQFARLCKMIGLSSGYTFKFTDREIKDMKFLGGKLKVLGELQTKIEFPATVIGYTFYSLDIAFLEFLELYVDTVQYTGLVELSNINSVDVSSFDYALQSHKLRKLFSKRTIQLASQIDRFKMSRPILFSLLEDPLSTISYFSLRGEFGIARQVIDCHPSKVWARCPITMEIGGWPNFLIDGYLAKRNGREVQLKEFYDPQWRRPRCYIEKICRLFSALGQRGFRIESQSDLALMYSIEVGDIDGVKDKVDKVPLQLNGWSLFLDMATKRDRSEIAEIILEQMEKERICERDS